MTRIRMFDLFGSLSGILFAVLAIIAVFVAGAIDAEIDDPSAEIADALEKARDRTATSFVLFGLALVFFLFFLGYLRDRCRRALLEDHWLVSVLWGSGLLFAAAYLILGFAQAAQFAMDDYGPDTQAATAVYALGWNSILLLAPPLMVFGATTALLSFVFKALPTWLGAGGVLVFLGGLVPWWGVIVFVLWVLAISIAWLIPPSRSTPASHATPAA